MKIIAPRAHPCSTVIWDVGGTLVDRVVGPAEALAQALGAVGMRLETVDAATLQRAHQQYLRTEPHWCTPEEDQARKGAASLIPSSIAGCSPGPLRLLRFVRPGSCLATL
jgi:hypothetical protein